MVFYKLVIFFLFLNFLTSATAQNPIVITFKSNDLLSNKVSLNAGTNKSLLDAKNKLVLDADKILKRGIKYSVTYNNRLNIGGVNNDYMSFGRYWWPNNSTKNGLPYILKDGVVNKQSDRISDKQYIDGISNDILTLGLAYFYTSNESYVIWAVELLKAFFINTSTKMNPNFNFSQVIPGNSKSGGSIMEAVVFLNLLDGMLLLSNSSNFKSSYQIELKSWFRDFYYWLENSSKGKVNATHKNNRATYYTNLKCAILIYIGEKSKAKRIFGSEAYRRINEQISSNGSMELELKRGVPLGYVKYNLVGFQILTNIGNNLGEDLAAYEGPKGQSIEKANSWVREFQKGNKKWDYSQEVGITYSRSKQLKRATSKELNSIRFSVNRFDNYLEVLTTKL